jgi:hypothetical protein
MDIDKLSTKNWFQMDYKGGKRTMKRKMRGGKKKRTKKKKKMRGGTDTPENWEDRTDTPENWEDRTDTPESDNYLGEMLLQQFENEEDYLWPNNPSVQVNIEDLDPVDIYDMPIEVMNNIADNLDFNDCQELRNYCEINPRICAMDERFREKYRQEIDRCKVESENNKSLKRFFQFKPNIKQFKGKLDMGVETIENVITSPDYVFSNIGEYWVGHHLVELLKSKDVMFNAMKMLYSDRPGPLDYGFAFQKVPFIAIVLYFNENPELLKDILIDLTRYVLEKKERLLNAVENNFMNHPEPVSENWDWKTGRTAGRDWLYSEWLFLESENEIKLLTKKFVDIMYDYLKRGKFDYFEEIDDY